MKNYDYGKINEEVFRRAETEQRKRKAQKRAFTAIVSPVCCILIVCAVCVPALKNAEDVCDLPSYDNSSQSGSLQDSETQKANEKNSENRSETSSESDTFSGDTSQSGETQEDNKVIMDEIGQNEIGNSGHIMFGGHSSSAVPETGDSTEEEGDAAEADETGFEKFVRLFKRIIKYIICIK